MPLPNHVLNAIHSICLQWFDPKPDSWAWRSNRGLFSMESAHSFLHQKTSSWPLDDWTWVWKIQGHPRGHHFFWLLLQNRLSTKSFLFHRQNLLGQSLPFRLFEEELVNLIMSFVLILRLRRLGSALASMGLPFPPSALTVPFGSSLIVATGPSTLLVLFLTVFSLPFAHYYKME